MMTEEIHTPKPFVIDERAELATYVGGTFAPPPINLPNKKRRVLLHCCSRLTASGLPGADLAVEYLHASTSKTSL